MKNLLEEVNSRFDLGEERISKLEKPSQEQSEQMKKN